jgi:glyoxylase-like metal-dependent hydrolase (beta-lactamase superfamily II)
MIEEVGKSLYRVEVPLPKNPLKSVNSYFIKSADRNLIIDTGMNLPESRSVFVSALEKLEIDLKKTDFFITHFHIDHLELATSLVTETSKLYLNQIESTVLNNSNRWSASRAFYLAYGFPEDELQKVENSHLVRGYRLGQFRFEFQQIKENDVFRIGDYTFQTINTPGHSPGHVCLYEPLKKILISGDHVLFDITPNITAWPNMENSLSEYLKNLDKIYPLEVNLVLPGHRSIRSDHRKRILELKEHHRARANEVLTSLNATGKTSYQVAALISWDVTYKSWDDFPAPQKFFAVGEVIAHLKYLEGQGIVRSNLQDGKIWFWR